MSGCSVLGGGPLAASKSVHVGSCSPSGPLIALSLQVDVQLQVAVPRPGRYALVVQYANEAAHQELGVAVHTPRQPPQQGLLTLHPCLYRCAQRGWEGVRLRPGGRVQAPGLPGC